MIMPNLEIAIYELVLGGQDKYIDTFNTTKEVIDFVGRKAQQLNYGLYRTWTTENRVYFDCGPKTFYVNDMDDWHPCQP